MDGAVRLSAAAADAEGREPTLRDVLEALFEPGAELVKRLLSDSQTRVIYQQASNELGNLRELLQLNAREVAAVSGLSPGMALWKVGQRSFVVEHLVSRAERWIVDTEPREQATHSGG